MRQLISLILWINITTISLNWQLNIMMKSSKSWLKWKRSICKIWLKRRKNSFKSPIFKSITWMKMFKKSLTWGKTLKPTFLQSSLTLRRIVSNSVFMNTDRNSPCLNMESKRKKTTSKQWHLMTKKCSPIKSLISKQQWKNSGNKILNQTETPITFNKIIRMNRATETIKIKEANCFPNIQRQFLSKTCTKCCQSQAFSKCKDKELLDTYLGMMRMKRRLFRFLPLNSRKSDS